MAAARLEIAELKVQAGEVTFQTVTKYVDRIRVVEKIKEVKVIEYVSKEADAKCVIGVDTSDNIRLLLNNAAKGIVPPSPRAASTPTP